MSLVLKIAAGIILAVVLLLVGCGALISASSDKNAATMHNPSAISDPDADAGNDDHPGETKAQENARGAAESYLSTSGFSRSGLIKQLKYEGYSLTDATYGVDALGADWNEQAARSAQSYLDTSSFSHSGLVDQLVYEGYTAAQAEAGVSAAGL